MNILGISAFYHDSAAALVRDGEVVAAAQEERFSRIRHDSEFPAQAVEYCLAAANITVKDLDRIVFYSHWQTNSYGHVSQLEYPMHKPPSEYRIAAVGDSMTANITNNVRWTELVEQQLNASAQWQASVDGRNTRVINFGLDGTGMLNFAGMVRHHVLDFEPDLVIVNFVSDSFFRRFRYNNVPYRGVDRDENIRRYIQKNFLDRIDWFTPYPQLFAATVGHFWDMPVTVPVDAKIMLQKAPDFRFETREEALEKSAAAIRDMLSAAPNILFLYMPLYEELAGNPPQDWLHLVEDIQREVPQFSAVSMKPALDALLPTDPVARDRELFKWFFLPTDRHYNDRGTSLYAHEVARLLIERPLLWQAAAHVGAT
jgi:hypothetical protein